MGIVTGSGMGSGLRLQFTSSSRIPQKPDPRSPFTRFKRVAALNPATLAVIAALHVELGRRGFACRQGRSGWRSVADDIGGCPDFDAPRCGDVALDPAEHVDLAPRMSASTCA